MSDAAKRYGGNGHVLVVGDGASGGDAARTLESAGVRVTALADLTKLASVAGAGAFDAVICAASDLAANRTATLTQLTKASAGTQRIVLARPEDDLLGDVTSGLIHCVLPDPCPAAVLVSAALQGCREARYRRDATRMTEESVEWKSQLEGALLSRNAQIERSREEMIEALVRALDAREHATSGHSMRVTAYSMRLAVEHGIDADLYPDIYYGSLLHDIGKIGIPDAVLLKTSALTSEERGLMESHVEIGLNILERVDGLGEAYLITRYHHERFDGGGYAEGLSGMDIPVQARVFAIADVYDALRTARPYKPAFAHDRVVSMIREESGAHFDPDLVAAFLRIPEDEWPRLAELSEGDMNFENLLLLLAKGNMSPAEC